MISWYFDVEYLRGKVKSGEYVKDFLVRNKKPMRLHTLSRLFLLPPGRYSLKIMGHEVLSDDSMEPLRFFLVPQDSFLVSIYLKGSLEKFNKEVVISDYFTEFLRRWIYPPELKRIPDPKLKEVSIEELRHEYILECPDIEGSVFDVLFGKYLNPVIFKRVGERAIVCSEIYFAERNGTLNPKRILIECDADSLSEAFFEMGVETLNSLEKLAQLLPEGPWREPLLTYIEVLRRFRNFLHSL
ncbi:hypothetical protein NF865_01750 [Thermococcus aggregans]|uniref:Uncharacterized protein n=1 Tax=Thermococcus aggregans TaxID=110163 RepID=A0A9E7MY82_THEAG|nr:hypothetical protein [Thermococcus aggregans]USS40969.1 hypothetical protein NF865_01750 [Thermococcus aggregans]